MIRKEAAGLELMGKPWPRHWHDAEGVICKLPGDYLTTEELDRNPRVRAAPPEEIPVFRSMLHDLGQILHFDKVPELAGIVVLKPEWATRAVFRVIDSREVKLTGGVFTRPGREDVSGHYPGE